MDENELIDRAAAALRSAGEAESERYLSALEILIVRAVNGSLTRVQLFRALRDETKRHVRAMYSIGGGVDG